MITSCHLPRPQITTPEIVVDAGNSMFQRRHRESINDTPVILIRAHKQSSRKQIISFFFRQTRHFLQSKQIARIASSGFAQITGNRIKPLTMRNTNTPYGQVIIARPTGVCFPPFFFLFFRINVGIEIDPLYDQTLCPVEMQRISCARPTA